MRIRYALRSLVLLIPFMVALDGCGDWSGQQTRLESPELSQVHKAYGSHKFVLHPLDESKLNRAMKNRLPRYEKYFQKSAKRHGIPWKLLAAVSYQESHWNPKAVSFTGVRGIMQLTTSTALFLGVADRENAAQSIEGGARYLRFLLDRQPADLRERERLLMALASYNVGYGHLSDAQSVAEKRGMDPFLWKDLRVVLPLLSNPAIAAELKFGKTRGEEPVAFVQRVLAYWELLDSHRLR